MSISIENDLRATALVARAASPGWKAMCNHVFDASPENVLELLDTIATLRTQNAKMQPVYDASLELRTTERASVPGSSIAELEKNAPAAQARTQAALTRWRSVVDLVLESIDPVDRYADLDETELRFFTLSLADGRHPAVCARCHKERIPSTRTYSGCTCSPDELRTWLRAQPIEQTPAEAERHCGRMLQVPLQTGDPGGRVIDDDPKSPTYGQLKPVSLIGNRIIDGVRSQTLGDIVHDGNGKPIATSELKGRTLVPTDGPIATGERDLRVVQQEFADKMAKHGIAFPFKPTMAEDLGSVSRAPDPCPHCRNGIRTTCPDHGDSANRLLVETETRHKRRIEDVPIRYTGDFEDRLEAAYWRFEMLRWRGDRGDNPQPERDAFKGVVRRLVAPVDPFEQPLVFKSLDGTRDRVIATAGASIVEHIDPGNHAPPSDQSLEMVTKLERLVGERGEMIDRLKAEVDHLDTRIQTIVDENVGPRPVGAPDDNLTRIERQFADLLRENAKLDVENNRLRRADEMDHRGVLVDMLKVELEKERGHLLLAQQRIQALETALNHNKSGVKEWRDKHSIACDTLSRMQADRDVVGAEVDKMRLSQDDYREQLANHTKVVQEREELRHLVADLKRTNDDLGKRAMQHENENRGLRERALQYEKDQRELCARLKTSEVEGLEARNLLGDMLDRHIGSHSTSLVQCATDAVGLVDAGARDQAALVASSNALSNECDDLKRAIDAHNANGIRLSREHNKEVEALKVTVHSRLDVLERKLIDEGNRIQKLERDAAIDLLSGGR